MLRIPEFMGTHMRGAARAAPLTTRFAAEQPLQTRSIMGQLKRFKQDPATSALYAAHKGEISEFVGNIRQMHRMGYRAGVFINPTEMARRGYTKEAVASVMGHEYVHAARLATGQYGATALDIGAETRAAFIGLSPAYRAHTPAALTEELMALKAQAQISTSRLRPGFLQQISPYFRQLPDMSAQQAIAVIERERKKVLVKKQVAKSTLLVKSNTTQYSVGGLARKPVGSGRTRMPAGGA